MDVSREKPILKSSARGAIAALLCGAAVMSSGARNNAGTEGEGMLLVANQHDRTLSIIDTNAGKQVAAVPEGGVTGHEVAVMPDGRTAFVPLYGNSGVGKPGTDGQKLVVIDVASQKVTGDVDFGHGVRPHCPVIGPKDGMLYVTTELDQAVTVIDPKTLKIVAKIPTGQPESHMLVISHDGRRGYTANVGPGTVSVLDMKAHKTVTIIPVSGNTQRISITPDAKEVFTADQTKPQLAVIDTAANRVKGWIELPGRGYGTAPTKDGKWLLVAVPDKSTVAVVDLSTLKVVRTIDVPKSPQEVLVRPDDKMAYVSCSASAQIAAINLMDWKVAKIIAAGQGADGMAWAAE